MEEILTCSVVLPAEEAGTVAEELRLVMEAGWPAEHVGAVARGVKERGEGAFAFERLSLDASS